MIDPSVAPWRRNAVVISLFVLAALCVVASAFMIYLQFLNSTTLASYRSAVSCTAPVDIAYNRSCSYSGSATVIGSRRPGALYVDLKFDDLRDRAFAAEFKRGNEPASTLVKPGSRAMAELWKGHVTKFDGVHTADNPEDLPRGYLLTALFFAAGFGLLLVWAIQTARQAGWRRPST